MRHHALLTLPVLFLLALVRPVSAEPAFGNNCLSCHSRFQTNMLFIVNEDAFADPDESVTGAVDRGLLPVFQVSRGQTKAIRAQFANLSFNDTYAAQLTRLRFQGVETGGTLAYVGDCNWPEWGESAPYYTDPVVSYRWGPGPTDFAFDISVDLNASPDYYDLVFAVAGAFDSDGGLFYARQHFYLQVLATQVGDIDSDGDVDYDDLLLFVPILLGENPELADRADMNGDSAVDGKDIQLFVDALLAGK